MNTYRNIPILQKEITLFSLLANIFLLSATLHYESKLLLRSRTASNLIFKQKKKHHKLLWAAVQKYFTRKKNTTSTWQTENIFWFATMIANHKKHNWRCIFWKASGLVDMRTQYWETRRCDFHITNILR